MSSPRIFSLGFKVTVNEFYEIPSYLYITTTDPFVKTDSIWKVYTRSLNQGSVLRNGDRRS